MPSGNCKKTFDLERRTVQKITFCLHDWKPIWPEHFSSSVPFSIITHELSKKIRFSTSYEHKEWGWNKKIRGRRVKSWPNVALSQLQSRKKSTKNIETLLAKQNFSLLFWDRRLKFMLQHPTMWFDRKQSKHPSKKLLLYEFLHKRSTNVWKTVTNRACGPLYQ